ncbi:MAG: 50S ribosomal protein L25/general stress protein Ctc [Cumulibacter sp.]
MVDDNRIDASPRTDFGKGAARRARRDGHVPAVLYGHGMDPVHLNLHRHQLTMALRQGLNSLLTVQVDGRDELALAKDVQVHPLQRVIQHVDLLLVRKGEKVAVDVPVEFVGDVVAGGQVNHDLTSVSIEAEATDIPESISVEIDGIEVGGQVLAGDLKLPGSATLLTDPEALIIAVSEVSAVAEDDEAEEAAEGEATEEAADADDAE